MAACANCLICLSSSIRGAGAWFLVLGIVSPTTTAPSAALARSSTHRHKIMSDDAPANVSFKSDLTLVKGSLHAKAVFERAHVPNRYTRLGTWTAIIKINFFSLITPQPCAAHALSGKTISQQPLAKACCETGYSSCS